VVDIGILDRSWSSVVNRVTGKRPGEMKKRWTFDAHSGILHSATINDIDDDGHKEIIFGSLDGTLYALSDSGKVKWTASMKEELNKTKQIFVEESTYNAITSIPVIGRHMGKKIIIAATASGHIAAFYADGKPCWRFRINGSIYTTPLYADINSDGKGEIIFGSNNEHLYVLDNDGKLMWKYNTKSQITSPAVMYDDIEKLIIFGTESGHIKAVNATGKFKWKYATEGKVTAKPVIADIFNDMNPRIIVGSNDKSLYVLDKKGKLEWKYQTHGEILSESIIADIDKDNESEIFFGACDDMIYAVAPNSQKIWSYETDMWIAASPIVTDIDGDGAVEVIAGSYDKSIYVLEGKGTFALNYLPGLSVVANQPGHLTPFITSHPGELVGKKLWQLGLDGIITGISLLDDGTKQVIVSTKEGKLFSVYYEK